MILHYLIKWLVYAAVFMAAASAIPTVKVKKFGGAMAAALAFGVANLLLAFVLSFVFRALLFLPAILTFGLAWLVVPFIVNMILLKVADGLTGDAFDVDDFGGLATLSVVITVAGALMRWLS